MEYQIKHFDEIHLKGYVAELPLPTMSNIAEISKLKSEHFTNISTNGSLPNLMQGSGDQIGYAFSMPTENNLEYFAGANTISQDDKSVERIIPAGNFVVLKGQGQQSRKLFDQMIQQFFSEIWNKRRELYTLDGGFIVEALLNGDPTDSVVELRIPTTVEK